MARISKSSTKLPSLANICDPEERLRRLCEPVEGNCFPLTESFIKNISLELINWADLPDSYLIKDFYNPRGYTKQKLHWWAEHFPVFAAAYDYAKEVIGTRRERKKIVEENCTFTLSFDNTEWRKKEDELHERKLQLASAKQNSAVPQTIIVETRKADDCPEVPHAPISIEVKNDGT